MSEVYRAKDTKLNRAGTIKSCQARSFTIPSVASASSTTRRRSCEHGHDLRRRECGRRSVPRDGSGRAVRSPEAIPRGGVPLGQLLKIAIPVVATALATTEGRIFGTVAYVSPSRPRANRPTRAPICFRWASSSTRWPPEIGRSRATSISIISSIVKDTPASLTRDLPGDGSVVRSPRIRRSGYAVSAGTAAHGKRRLAFPPSIGLNGSTLRDQVNWNGHRRGALRISGGDARRQRVLLAGRRLWRDGA